MPPWILRRWYIFVAQFYTFVENPPPYEKPTAFK